MFKHLTIAALALLTPAAVAQEGEHPQANSERQAPAITLTVGDKAPQLEGIKWVTGEPIKAWKPGEIYILDFWATWCIPCIRSIPHIDKIADEHKDDGVHVIGVAVMDELDKVRAFAEGKGDAMSYPVVFDAKGKAMELFMKAAGRNGIPSIFIIDREGKIAWIGHPEAGLDEVLAQIVAGTFDAEAYRREAEREAERIANLQRQAAEYRQAAQQAAFAGDWEAVVAQLQKIVAIDPEYFAGELQQIYAVAVTELQDKQLVQQLHKQILSSSAIMQDSQLLNAFAWFIAAPNASIPKDIRDLDFALKLAEKAHQLTEESNASIVDTLARVKFEMGQVEEAIKLQQQAVELAEPGPMQDALLEALKEYQKHQHSS